MRIERTRGRGTFVLHPRLELDFGGSQSFTSEMQSRGLDPETRVVAPARSRRARPRPTLWGSRSARRRSTSSASASPTASHCCSSRSISRPTGSGLLASDLEHNSLYQLLTERYGTRVVRAREAIEPVLLRGREAKLLDQPSGRPALLVEGIAFAADGVPSSSPELRPRRSHPRYYVERLVVRSPTAPVEEPVAGAGIARLAGTGRRGCAAVPEEGRERRHPSRENDTFRASANPESARSAMSTRLRASALVAVLVLHRRGVRPGTTASGSATAGVPRSAGPAAAASQAAPSFAPAACAGTAASAPARTRSRSRRGRGRRGLRREARRQQPEVRGHDVQRGPQHAVDPDRVRQRSGSSGRSASAASPRSRASGST